MALLPEDPNSRVTYPVLKTPDLAFGGPGVCRVGSHGGATVGQQVVKSCLSIAIEMGEWTSVDWTRV
jgi:hypothetical protein